MSEALAQCDAYLRGWLPGRLSAAESSLLLSVGVPVAIELRDGSERKEWLLLQMAEGLAFPEDAAPRCRYSMTTDTFRALVSARQSPQRALFTGRLRISGDKLLAVRLGGLLESVFRRVPWDGEASNGVRHEATAKAALRLLDEHQREMLALHLDPADGAPWWVESARRVGIRATDLETHADLAAFGFFDRDAAVRRPWRDFVPKRVLREATPLTLGETGGATGLPMTSAWTAADFRAAFVEPLAGVLRDRRLRALRQWLFVGPTGPHIIGKAADALARETTGIDALKVDFDPRWHRSLMPGSPAAARHREHLLAQAVVLLERERPDALFVTPSVLRCLLDREPRAWRDALRLVHLGGQGITRDLRAWLQERLPGACALVNGYGNSLFGCVIEDAARPLHYPCDSSRLVLEVVRDPADPTTLVGPGDEGRVMFHRFDESMMILNAVERDEATRTEAGILEPRPAREAASVVAGIY